jgi:hypothetical protein
MGKLGKYDGLILGVVAGLLIIFPNIGSTILNFWDGVIPSTWNWFGAYTNKILLVVAFALIGLITDKTGKR